MPKTSDLLPHETRLHERMTRLGLDGAALYTLAFHLGIFVSAEIRHNSLALGEDFVEEVARIMDPEAFGSEDARLCEEARARVRRLCRHFEERDIALVRMRDDADRTKG